MLIPNPLISLTYHPPHWWKFHSLPNLSLHQNISSGNNQLLFAKTLHCRLMPPHTVILTEIDYHPMCDNWTCVFGNFVSLWECAESKASFTSLFIPPGSPIPMAFSNTYLGWTWDSVLGSKPSFTPINSLSIPLGSQTHSDGIFIYMQLVEPVTACSNLNPPSPPSIPYSESPFLYTCIKLSLWQCVWIQGFLHPLAFPIHPPGIPYPP